MIVGSCRWVVDSLFNHKEHKDLKEKHKETALFHKKLRELRVLVVKISFDPAVTKSLKLEVRSLKGGVISFDTMDKS